MSSIKLNPISQTVYQISCIVGECELVNDSTLTRFDSNPFLTGRNFVIQEFVRNRKKCLQEHQT